MTEIGPPSPLPPARESDLPRRRPRRRARRWLGWLLFTIAALLLIGMIATQVVLSFTDLPRRIIVGELQRSLGLRADIGSVTTSWLGRTSLRDVTFSVPLSDQPLVSAPVVRVRHTWLPMILAKRSVSIGAIELDRPTLRAVQLDTGEWNLRRAIDRIVPAASERPADGGERRGGAGEDVPDITIKSGTLFVRDNTGREATIAPLDVVGRRDGPLLWRFTAQAPPLIDVRGQVAPGSGWHHEIDFALLDLDRILGDWIKQPTTLAGRWEGHAPDGATLDGRLVIANGRVGDVHPRGVAAISLANGALTVRPDRMLIETGHNALGRVRLLSGAIALHDNNVEADSLEVELGGGVARIDGRWKPRDDVANVEASWRDVSLPDFATHSGTLHAVLTSPLPGQPQLRMTLASTGRTLGAGTWDWKINLAGQGTSWEHLRLQLRGEHLAWNGTRQLAIDNVVANITTDGRRATVENVQLEGSDRLSGRGGYDFDRRSFWLWLRGDELLLDPNRNLPLTVMLNAWGDGGHVRVQQFFAQAPELELSGDGDYVFDAAKPLDLQLYLRLANSAGAMQRITGRLHGEARIRGDVSPLALDADGHFFADDLTIADRLLGDVKARVTGQVDAHDARVNFTQFRLFDGDCQIEATRPTDGRRDPTQVSATVSGLSLEKAAKFFDASDVSGRLSGAWSLRVPRNTRRAAGEGTFTITGLVAANHFDAQTITGTMRLADQRITVNPLDLRQDNGTVLAEAGLLLTQPRIVDLKLQSQRWPLKLPDVRGSAAFDGTSDVRVDVASRSASGNIDGIVHVALANGAAGDVKVRADLRGRRAKVDRLEGSLLGGSVSGFGAIDLDNIESQTAQINWTDIDGEQVAQFWPALQGLAGRYSGQAHLGAPTDEHRPLEPLRLTATWQPSDAHWRAVQIGPGRAVAYVSRRRAVLDQSAFAVAGGTVKLWARVSEHGTSGGTANAAGSTDRTIGTNIIVDWDSIDLNQIARSIAPDCKPVPGRLNGNAHLVGAAADPERMVGTGSLAIADSDLVNFGPAKFLYDAMRLDLHDKAPAGHGAAEFRIEAADLIISQLRYFNRGTEIRANGTVHDFRAGNDAQLDIGAVGSAQPLSQIEVPGFADADRIFSVLQSNLTTVHIGGTVREPRTRTVSLDEMSQTLRAIVFGDYQQERAQQQSR